MKLAHLADLHLGFRQYTRQTRHGINQRETDVATAFRRAVDGVEAARPDVVIVAGDVFCVPHSAIRAASRPTMRPEAGVRWNVLLTHGEVAGVVPGDRSFVEYGGAMVEPGDLHAEQWSYVALGHYHVAQQVTPNAWYAGSLEFVSSNPWGELREGDRLGWGDAKGWLLATLGDGHAAVEFVPLERSRRHIVLVPVDGGGKTAAELDELIKTHVAGIPEGLDDQVVRQLITNVSRHVARDVDHSTIRDYKARALHYHLDIRRPGAKHEVGVGFPGRRRTLEETVTQYLERREVAPGVERSALVALGRRYLEQVERDVVEG